MVLLDIVRVWAVRRGRGVGTAMPDELADEASLPNLLLLAIIGVFK